MIRKVSCGLAVLIVMMLLVFVRVDVPRNTSYAAIRTPWLEVSYYRPLPEWWDVTVWRIEDRSKPGFRHVRHTAIWSWRSTDSGINEWIEE